jgi:MFS transporter, DHA2 family, multidrug resistance protein
VTTIASRSRSYQPQTSPQRDGSGITRRQWLALGVMSFTVLLISLDQTVLNVALPTLVKELHPSSSGLQWIADSYTLTTAVMLLFGGALGDRFGRRRLFLIGTAIFGGGSLACALVHSTGALIGARAVMGLGAAFLMPATLSIIASMFSGHRRARAIGIWVGVGGIGTAAGPLLGGWLLQHFWWGSVFLINVPVAILALLGGFFAVSESRAINRPSLDPFAVVLSSLGLTALTYGLIVTSTDGWGSTTVVASLSFAVVLLVVFVLWDRSRRTPFLDLRLFANRTFSSALGAVTAVFFAMFGVSYLLSQYIQFVQGADPFGVGIRFLPLAAGSLLGSNTASRLTVRFGLRTMMLVGMTLVTGGLVSLATLTVASGFVTLGLGSGLIGLGMGLVIAPASNAIVGTLAPDKVGAGSGLRAMVQLLGGSFGVAIVGSLATRTYRSDMQQAFAGPLRKVPAGVRKLIGNQLGDAQGAAGRLPHGLGQATRHAADHAFVSGLHLSALVGVGIMVVAIAAAAVYVPARVAIVHDDDDVNVVAHM